MAAALCRPSSELILDNYGRPAPGARIAFFAPGTSNPLTVYTDGSLTLAQPIPVIADGFGRVPNCFTGVQNYDVRVETADGQALYTLPSLAGAPSNSGSGGTDPVITVAALPTGFMAPAFLSGAQPGWVRANGKTIGPAGSGATELADDSTRALYLALWNGISTLAVLGGRGTSALADWASGKPISVPDARGRTLVGLDGMGNGRANVITGASFSSVEALANVGGFETVALTVDHLAAHDHGTTIEAGGRHTHTVQVDSGGAHDHATSVQPNGDHTHAGVTDLQGQHVHNYQDTTYNTFAATTAGGPGRQDFVGAVRQTDSAGNHQHNFTTDSKGSHTHVVTVQSGGAHTHTAQAQSAGSHTHVVTLAKTGGGAAHGNVQPSMLVTWYIKL